MQDVMVTCDRCKTEVKGAEYPGATVGFYRITGYWERFANPGEHIICDRCMWIDPRYIAVYGHQTLSPAAAPSG